MTTRDNSPAVLELDEWIALLENATAVLAALKMVRGLLASGLDAGALRAVAGTGAASPAPLAPPSPRTKTASRKGDRPIPAILREIGDPARWFTVEAAWDAVSERRTGKTARAAVRVALRRLVKFEGWEAREGAERATEYRPPAKGAKGGAP